MYSPLATFWLPSDHLPQLTITENLLNDTLPQNKQEKP